MTTRRKLLALIASGAAANKLLDSGWVKPAVETVLLPAHAQTTEEPPSTINVDIASCGATDANPAQCAGAGIGFSIQGTLIGDDVTGATLNVAYTNMIQGGGNATVNFQTLVQAGNVFSDSFLAIAPSMELWGQPGPADIVVSFVDQATYGTSTCETTFTCTSNEL